MKYKTILSAQIQQSTAKLIRLCFTEQKDNPPKQTVKVPKGFLKAEKLDILLLG